MHSKRSSISDFEQCALVEASANGDAVSFEKLVRLYQSKVRAYAQIYTDQTNEQVDDLAQDIFLQIYLSLDSFSARSTVATWIFSIAKNTVNNKIRKKKLLYFWPLSRDKEGYSTSLVNRQQSCERDGEFYYQVEQDRFLIRSCLAKLNQDQREVLVLFEYSNLGYAEIALVLRVGVGTVKSRLFNARKALAKEVIANND